MVKKEKEDPETGSNHVVLLGRAALVTGQALSFQKPDLRAHAFVAPSYAQTPARLWHTVESCRSGLLRDDREEQTV